MAAEAVDFAPDIIRAACASLHLGRVIESEALLYLQCALESPTFGQPRQHQAPLAATTIYLAVRMHQLPISVHCVVSAVGQKSKFSVRLFWKVAQAVHETPPAVDYTRFALLVMADVVHTKASLKLQVLNLYAKLMVWLEGAAPTICVQTNTWTAAALQLAIQFYKVNAPHSLLTTHFGIAAALFDQTVKIVQNLLTAAAVRLHAGNPSLSEAIQTVLLSSVPAPLEQHLRKLSCEPVKMEALPPQAAAPLHAARVVGAVSLETPSALTGNQKQLDRTVADGADSSPSTVDAGGTAADVDANAGGIAAPAGIEDITAGDIVATAAGYTAPAADDDGDATARANQVLLGSDTPGADEKATACHLQPQVRGCHVQGAPRDSQGGGKAQHDTTEQTEQSQAYPQQIKLTAAQLPVTQPPPPQAPTLQRHHNLAPVSVHTSAASTQMISAAPSSTGISVASSALLRGSQPTQLPLSPSLAAPSVPAPAPRSYSHQCVPMHVTWQQQQQRQQQRQQQQQQPSQLLGPATRMLHSMLLQLERARPQHTTAHMSEPLYPPPPPTRPPTFPSVLLQDPRLLDRVQSTFQLQGNAQEGPQGPDRAQRQARSALDAVDASQDASMNAEGLLQADPVAAAGLSASMLGTNASPLGLLPEPLHAAIASAMGTAGAAAAADVAMSLPTVSLAPACKAGSPARDISQQKWRGTKRRRAESGSHDGMSSRAQTAAAGPVGPSTASYAATQDAQKQQTAATKQRAASSKATDSAAAPASTDFPAPCVVQEAVVGEDILSSAPSQGANEVDTEAQVSRLPAAVPEETADLEEGHSDDVSDMAGSRSRMHTGFPSTQKDSCRVDAVSRCNPDEAVECMLASHSGLDSDDPSETRTITKRQCSDGAPAEQVSDTAQPAGRRSNCEDALQRTPERGNACDVTASRALPTSTGLCTRERSAKDALLMLSIDQPESMSVPCEHDVREQTADLASGDEDNCVNRPPPFADVEGAVAYEVDKIFDKRYYRAGSQVRVQYLVRWKGYGPEDDTWQSPHSLRHARQAIQEYEDIVHV